MIVGGRVLPDVHVAHVPHRLAAVQEEAEAEPQQVVRLDRLQGGRIGERQPRRGVAEAAVVVEVDADVLQRGRLQRRVAEEILPLREGALVGDIDEVADLVQVQHRVVRVGGRRKAHQHHAAVRHQQRIRHHEGVRVGQRPHADAPGSLPAVDVGRFADRLAKRGDLHLFAGDRALEHAGSRQQVHARLRVAVERRRGHPVGPAQTDQPVAGDPAGRHVAVAVQREILRLLADTPPFAVAATHDQRGKAVQLRLLVQQACRARAVREQVGGLLGEQRLQLRVAVGVHARLEFAVEIAEAGGQRELRLELAVLDRVEQVELVGEARLHDGPAGRCVHHLADRQRVVEVLVGRLHQHHADQLAVLVQQRAAAVAGRGGSGEAHPLPGAVLLFRRVGGVQAVADHHAGAERVAHRVDHLVERRAGVDLQRRIARRRLRQREHHEILAQRELLDLADGVDAACGIAQFGRPPQAVRTGQQHVGSGDVAVVADRERRADGVVLVGTLLVGQLIQRQRPLVGQRIPGRFGLHHLEGGGLDLWQHRGIKAGRPCLRHSRQAQAG